MPRVVHFEIAADDPDKAAAFYQEVFGWKIVKWEGTLLEDLPKIAERGLCLIGRR